VSYEPAIMGGATNLHPNRVQQALTDPANPRDLAYGKVAHKVLDRLGIVRQTELPVRLVLKRKANLYQETGERIKETFVLCRNRSESQSVYNENACGSQADEMHTLASIWNCSDGDQ
jgi:hypothetical protein